MFLRGHSSAASCHGIGSIERTQTYIDKESSLLSPRVFFLLQQPESF